MIQLRTYDEPRDYPLVEAWWTARGLTATPAACVPKLGVIASERDRDIFAAWVSMDNSCGLCCLLWPVANPAAPARKIAAAIPVTVELLQLIVKDMGYHTLVALTHVQSIARSFGRHGFSADPLPVQTLYKTLT